MVINELTGAAVHFQSGNPSDLDESSFTTEKRVRGVTIPGECFCNLEAIWCSLSILSNNI